MKWEVKYVSNYLNTYQCVFKISEDPSEYYYYDGGDTEYGDLYYDNEEYSEAYNYEDATEGKNSSNSCS